MDLSRVTAITTPAGSLTRLKVGGVTFWQKFLANKYKILKDGVQVAEVTIEDFVKAVQSGDAQTDWGIGAQIIVPYHDPFDNNDYELPFHFGTFTAYGAGKLGLQAHYAVPTEMVIYGDEFESAHHCCYWDESDAYSWLNNNENSQGTNHWKEASKTFPECIPNDFYDAMLSLEHGNIDSRLVSSKVFLLGIVASCASLDSKSKNEGEYIYTPNAFYTENAVWEYWANKITTPQVLNTTNSARIVQSVNGINSRIAIPNLLTQTNTRYNHDDYFLLGFTNAGLFVDGISGFPSFRYLPACVIG